MADQRIDFTKQETEDVSKQLHTQRETRPQYEKEKNPDYYQRTQERTR